MTRSDSSTHAAGPSGEPAGVGEASLQPALDPLGRAILATIVYGDVFDYPLEESEIQRRLIGCEASLESVRKHLATSPFLASRVRCTDGFWSRVGREHLAHVRSRRRAAAPNLWERAKRYTRVLASVPFVRGVFVTGALASDNEEASGDVDFMVVVEPGCLWRCHALIWLLVKLDHAFGGRRLCVNYYLAADRPSLSERSLYVATELALMTPQYGRDVYDLVRDANPWSHPMLPNARPAPAQSRELAPLAPRLRRLLAASLDSPPGAWLERRVQALKLARVEARSQQVEPAAVPARAGVRDGWARSERARRVAAYREAGRGFRGRHTTDELTLCDLDFGDAIEAEYQRRLALALEGPEGRSAS